MWDEIPQIEHHNASELLKHFIANQSAGIIYRGLGHQTWTLSPSISRATGSRKLNAIYADDSRAFKEIAYLARFVNACDDAGLKVAGDSDQLREFLLEPRGPNSHGRVVDLFKYPSLWPSDDNAVFHFLAQAQHHGVPTRLLDWTTSPLVSCYFTVSQAIHERRRLLSQREDANLSEWMLAVVELDTIQAAGFKETFKIRHAPGSTSQNLAAQKGRFTFIKGFELGDLDLLNHRHSRNYLKRHLLPLSEAYNLMRQIEMLGVTTATLFPGHDGAAKDSIETMLLEDLDQEIRDFSSPRV
ncbi:FRG domain-containing protein [Halomonas elongata]|uniref:FRG domain-containing protein n=1 Tax=Halomonas elongata TaxID=2746 RepID=UPI0023AF17FF|nr:FRG domain-containing protein [Halomonas elongata]